MKPRSQVLGYSLHYIQLRTLYLYILSLSLFLPPIAPPLSSLSLPHHFTTPFTLSVLSLNLPSTSHSTHSHDLPTDQVYIYDGTQSCEAANFVPFQVLASLVILGFVFVAPFLLCLLTKKRWTVSFCMLIVASLNL